MVTAFIRPLEGVNAGMIRTREGAIMVDTTSAPAEADGLLEAGGARVDEVHLVINTHFHSDHTWGNQVFTCSKLAQRLYVEGMHANPKPVGCYGPPRSTNPRDVSRLPGWQAAGGYYGQMDHYS